MTKQNLTLTLLILSIRFIGFACDCSPNSIGQATCESDLIAVVKVISKETKWIKQKWRVNFDSPSPDTIHCKTDIDGKSFGKDLNYCIPITVYTIEVNQLIKGNKNKTSYLIYTNESSNCSKTLEIDQEYLCYLNSEPKQDIHGVDLYSQIDKCSRILQIQNSSNDLKFISKIRNVQNCDEVDSLEQKETVKYWKELSNILNIEIDSLYSIKSKDSVYIFPIHIKHFGPKNGVIICNKKKFNQSVFHKIYELEYHILNYNNLTFTETNIKYYKDLFNAMGYNGNEKPIWVNDSLKE